MGTFCKVESVFKNEQETANDTQGISPTFASRKQSTQIFQQQMIMNEQLLQNHENDDMTTIIEEERSGIQSKNIQSVAHSTDNLAKSA